MSPQFKHCPDPCFTSIEQYLKYFDSDMLRVSFARAQVLNNNQDEDTQKLNRYIDIFPYRHSMVTPRGVRYFNGNVVDLLGYKFFIT